ncbi:MAG: helix-turn-helix transcriptional regulator [Halopseudomonas aestusnigri]
MNSQQFPYDSSDKRDVAYIFRERMALLIAQSGNNLSQFSKSIGIDRSALSQFLAPDSTRLPRAETLCAISRACGVSLDWIMGLIANDGNSDEIVPSIEIMRMNEEEATLKIEDWHREATGYKIRYVPNTLPDIMRIDEVSEFEFKYNHLFIRKAQNKQAKRQLIKTDKPDTDIEVCMPLQTLELFAKGEGVWQELSKEIRKKQLEHMLKLVGEFYPTFRLFFFDQKAAYSAPYTLFGPLRAAVYLGNMYLLVNSVDHIKALTQHFDRLIKLATVGPDRAEERIREFLTELR